MLSQWECLVSSIRIPPQWVRVWVPRQEQSQMTFSWANWLRWWRICLQCRRPGFDPWVGKIPWRREWQPTPVFLPGESHGQRKLAGYSPGGHRELDSTEQLTLSLSGASSFLFLGLSFVLMKWWVWTMWSPRCPLVFYHLRVLWCSLPLMERSPKSIAGDPAHMSLFWERRV